MKSGVCKKTIDRHKEVQSIAWCPGGEGQDRILNDLVRTLELLHSFHVCRGQRGHKSCT